MAMASAAASFMLSVISRGPGVEGAAEDAGEGEHVVDLVGVVAATGGDDGGDVGDELGPDLGIGVGHGEDDRVLGHRRDVVGGDEVGRGHADEHVGAGERPAERAGEAVGVGVLGEPPLRALRSSRPVCTAPLRSQPTMHGHAGAHEDLGDGHAGGADAGDARPGGRASACRRPGAAFSRAARVTTAVPCWSSWNTGMSRRSRRRSSTSKHTGAAMSSRLMPPKTGAMRCTVSTICVGASRSRDVEADREGVDAGELLEQQGLALHHRAATPRGRCRPGRARRCRR